jgi:hypothetical protein
MQVKVLSAIALVIFVLWLGLISGFFYANVSTRAGDAWNYAVAITTSAGAVLFLILGMVGIFASKD